MDQHRRPASRGLRHADRGRGVIGQSASGASEAGIGHAAVVGALIGYLAVLAVVSGIVLAAGAGLRPAVAVGAYVAIWGGPGWGGMIAAQRYADRIAADERRAKSPPRPGVAPEHRPSPDRAAARRATTSPTLKE